MAYDFDGTTQYITTTAPPITDFPLTMCCWAKADAYTSASTPFSFGVSSTTRNFAAIAMNTGPVWSSQTTDNGGTGRIMNGASAVLGTWQFICITFDGDPVTNVITAREIFVDTAKNSSGTTFGLSPVWDRLAIGARRRSTVDGRFNGSVAECAAWDVILDDEEIKAMADGLKPNSVRPGNLKFYAPIIRDIADYASATSLTNTNTAIVTDHVRRYG